MFIELAINCSICALQCAGQQRTPRNEADQVAGNRLECSRARDGSLNGCDVSMQQGHVRLSAYFASQRDSAMVAARSWKQFSDGFSADESWAAVELAEQAWLSDAHAGVRIGVHE